MVLPIFTMRQLLESGVHFGHVTRRWNPKMENYIFGVRQGVHILDLQQTVPLINRAMQAVKEVVAGGGRVLFVGTKRQASTPIREAAKRCGQYYVDHRWLGGMMTNWTTISKSIKRLHSLDETLNADNVGLTKKELLRLTRERDKLERALGGIKEMGALPNILFVIDTNKESISVAEANRLGIPVVGVIDSNSDPRGVDYPIPGNDDSLRAISLYCNLIAGAVLSGIQEEISFEGGDPGAQVEPPNETIPGRSANEHHENKPEDGLTEEFASPTPEITPSAPEASGNEQVQVYSQENSSTEELEESGGTSTPVRENDASEG